MDPWSGYQSMPTDQVNWAEVAQQWMAMKAAQDDHHSGNGYDDLGRSHQYRQENGKLLLICYALISLTLHFMKTTGSTEVWSSGPNRPIFPSANHASNDTRSDGYRGQWSDAHGSAGGPPPPPPPHPHMGVPVGTMGDFGGSSFASTPRQPPSQFYREADATTGPDLMTARWGGPPGPGTGWIPPPPFFPPPFTTDPMMMPPPPPSGHGLKPNTAPFFNMDANARKKLPAWIQEGLEKAEREKLKQQEKEERIRRAEEEKAKRRALAGKGRFDSSSDEEDNNADDERSKSRPSWEREDDGDPIFIMVAVKYMMMTLLMEATDEAMRRALEECLREAKPEAEPKLLAKSSALAALSSLGGGDESDDETEDGRGDAERDRKSGSPASDGSDDSTAFKAPFGIPRKFSKPDPSSLSEETNGEKTKSSCEFIVYMHLLLNLAKSKDDDDDDEKVYF
uniref:Arginine/serine-rich protein PNISR n=1 Tax=Heterorhabditis bacteriophora TaxID=37862 RepID=A0A1I7WTW6_HETBA